MNARVSPRIDLIGLVVADMAASLAFYRRLGLDVPADADARPHAEAALPGGLRLAWDTVDTVRSFDPGWVPAAGRRISLAFDCGSPEGVDALYAELTAAGYDGPPQAVGRLLGAALRRRPRPGRQRRRPLRGGRGGGALRR